MAKGPRNLSGQQVLHVNGGILRETLAFFGGKFSLSRIQGRRSHVVSRDDLPFSGRIWSIKTRGHGYGAAIGTACSQNPTLLGPPCARHLSLAGGITQFHQSSDATPAPHPLMSVSCVLLHSCALLQMSIRNNGGARPFSGRCMNKHTYSSCHLTYACDPLCRRPTLGPLENNARERLTAFGCIQ